MFISPFDQYLSSLLTLRTSPHIQVKQKWRHSYPLPNVITIENGLRTRESDTELTNLTLKV